MGLTYVSPFLGIRKPVECGFKVEGDICDFQVTLLYRGVWRVATVFRIFNKNSAYYSEGRVDAPCIP
jgi:hypothetical protein